jgi:diguanylate cyclase (GGDEF)-like protein
VQVVDELTSQAAPPASDLQNAMFLPNGHCVYASQGLMPLDLSAHGHAFATALVGGRTSPEPVHGPVCDDQKGAVPQWTQLTFGPWFDASGAIIGVLVQSADLTCQAQTTAVAEFWRQRLDLALDLETAAVRDFNIQTGQVTSRGHGPAQVMWSGGRAGILDMVHPDDQQAVGQMAAVARVKGERFAAEYRTNEPDDAEVWQRAIVEFVHDAQGQVERVLIAAKDITQQRNSQIQIETLAYRDALTGLANRTLFQREFQLAVDHAAAHGERIGLIMVDVDHFKDINDTLGHDAGDALLVSMANHLREAFRKTDTLARLGGDEFAIILRDLDGEADLRRPLDVLRTLFTHPILHGGHSFTIRASIGAALHLDPGADPAHLIKNADIALYKAKHNGRNQLVLFEPDMRSNVEQKIELLHDVRGAIPRQEFELYYQPIINLKDGQISGFEALMRWDHPVHGVLKPGTFAAAFNDYDLSLRLGEVTIDRALQQMRAWKESHVDYQRVAINISSAQFRTGHFAQDLSARLRHWGVDPASLTVEITENVFMGLGSMVVNQTVCDLHDVGILISLDDFGTGYASLANLKRFPIDRLKIDRSFVQNVNDDAIVRAVISLGASMGMKVVAEGVETLEQLTTLSGYGCDQAQGYYFARPMPARDVPSFLRLYKPAVPAVA